MIASLAFYLVLSSEWTQSKLVGEGKFFSATIRDEEMMVIVAVLTIITWLTVTLLTKPESPEVLTLFYRKIRPGGPGWKPIASKLSNIVSPDSLGLQIAAAFLSTALVYTILPGIGYLIFRQWTKAGICLVMIAVWAVPLTVIVRKLFPREPAS